MGETWLGQDSTNKARDDLQAAGLRGLTSLPLFSSLAQRGRYAPALTAQLRTVARTSNFALLGPKAISALASWATHDRGRGSG